MINQVVPNSVPKTGTFNDFRQPKNGWYLAANHFEDENKRSTNYGKTIAIAALVTGFGTFALMRGFVPKSASKYLENLRLKLEEKALKAGKLRNFYRYALNKVENYIEKSGSINNITSLKDVLFQRLMFGKDGKRTFTKKIHQGITNLFTKISRKTVNSSYASTHSKFATLNEYLIEVNEKILERNSDNPQIKSALDNITSRMETVNQNLEKGFGINARNKRLNEMNKATEDLFDYFWQSSFSDIKNFKSANMYQTFIAEKRLMPNKMKLSNDVGILRRKITHNIEDTSKATSKAVDNIQRFINPTDESSNEILNILRKNLKSYKKLSGDSETLERTELNTEIIANLKKLSKSFSDNAAEQNYSQESVDAVSKYISEFEDIISNSSKGELQEILTEYKKLLPRSEYLKVKEHVNKAIKSLDKSIDIEISQFFDKNRDLKLGSAPTDILSVIGSVGAVGWFLGKSKDKDERISASLKYGIPAIGAIATSLYCTARLISGGKSMAFGIISGLIINKIGTSIDNTRKKYSFGLSVQNKAAASQNKS